MSATLPSPSPAAALRALGDLDSPLWGDERSRLVWLEASAVAQRLMSFLAWLLAVAMIWVGGWPMFWWSAAVIWLVALGNLAGMRYAAAYGLAQPGWRERLRSPRQWVLFALGAAWVAGVLVARSPGTVTGSFAWGLVTGAAVAVVAVVVAERRISRRADLPEDDTFD